VGTLVAEELKGMGYRQEGSHGRSSKTGSLTTGIVNLPIKGDGGRETSGGKRKESDARGSSVE